MCAVKIEINLCTCAVWSVLVFRLNKCWTTGCPEWWMSRLISGRHFAFCWTTAHFCLGFLRLTFSPKILNSGTILKNFTHARIFVSHYKPVTLIPSLFYPGNDVCFFTSAAYNLDHFKLEFVMEANNMNPDQTAPWRSLICIHIACNTGSLNT